MYKEYNRITKKLARYPISRVKLLLKAEENKPGWTASRSLYLVVLRNRIGKS